MTTRLISLASGLLLSTSLAFAQQAPAQPTDLGYWNGPAFTPLRADAASIGLRFAPGTDELAIRQLLAGLEALAPGQAGDVLLIPGQTVSPRPRPSPSARSCGPRRACCPPVRAFGIRMTRAT